MGNISVNTFGKQLDEVVEEDITNYFNEPKVESDLLEFKSFPARADFSNSLDGILKAICGMLNSAGGVIIWGAPSGRVDEASNDKIFEGNLTALPVLKTKDWLINKISSAISPLPIGIEVKIISCRETYLYLFEIKESIYKPHQFNHTYYIRLDGQTKPAPHFIVQALMRQVSYPDIRGVIKFSPVHVMNGFCYLPISVGLFNFSRLQNEENTSFRILCINAQFNNWEYNTDRTITFNHNGSEIICERAVDVLYFGMPRSFGKTLKFNVDTRTLKLVLSFGGLKSPAKSSYYELDASNLSLANPMINLIEVKENILFADGVQINENEMIQEFTGR